MEAFDRLSVTSDSKSNKCVGYAGYVFVHKGVHTVEPGKLGYLHITVYIT